MLRALPSLRVLFSFVLTYGNCFNEIDHFDMDSTCFLQSYIELNGSNVMLQQKEMVKMSSPLHKKRVALLSSQVTRNKFHATTLDETSQVMIGLLLLLMVFSLVGIVFALKNSDVISKDAWNHDEKTLDYRDSQRSEVGQDLPGTFYKPQGPSPRRVDSSKYCDFRQDSRNAPAVPSISPRSVKLSSSLVVPQGREMVYYLPDISDQRKPLEPYTILGRNDDTALGVLVKMGDDDPGILLHDAPGTGGPGSPVAFVATAAESIRAGQLRILSPSNEQPTGELFGMLEREGDAFKVSREGQLILSITGDPNGFTLSTPTGKLVGETFPAGNKVELRLPGGADAALAVVCILVIMQLNGPSNLSNLSGRSFV